MNTRSRHVFEFDEFRLEVEDRCISRNGTRVPLTSRDFDILLALVNSAGATVDKDVLMDTVWEGTFVEEGNLNRHVSTIRKALGDDSREQKLIKTIPKKGYRFTADIRETVENVDSIMIENVSSARVVMREETTEGFWTATKIAAAGIVLVMVSFISAWGIFGGGSRGARAAMAPNPEAQEAYRQGRELWENRSADGLHNATLLLEKATRLDPEFALAHAALADAYAFDYGHWRKAEETARRAIAIDADLGQPHASIGFVRMFWQWDLVGSQAELKQAIDLQPDYAPGHQWYALNLAASGAGDAALVEIEKAAALEPRSAAINTDKCQILYFAERFDAAREQCESVLALDPGSENARELIYQIAMSSERYDEAVRLFVELCSRSRHDGSRTVAADLQAAYRNGGITAFRAAQIKIYTNTAPSIYKLARVRAESGDIHGAINSLTDAATTRDFDVIFYVSDPAFKLVRASPEVSKVPGMPTF